MLYKLRQQRLLKTRTPSNRTPNARSRSFIINFMRQRQKLFPTPAGRATLGLVRWAVRTRLESENRISYRMQCYITGRSRGVLRRYNIARTKIKALADAATLPGLRKSSW